MGRGTATLLLLVFSLSPVAPLFAGRAEATVPACCRRNGKHDCMQHVTPPQDGKQFKASGVRCPLFPKSLAAPGDSTQVLPPASQSFYASVVAHPAIHAQVATFYRICWSRSQQKRGPPLLIA